MSGCRIDLDLSPHVGSGLQAVHRSLATKVRIVHFLGQLRRDQPEARKRGCWVPSKQLTLRMIVGGLLGVSAVGDGSEVFRVIGDHDPVEWPVALNRSKRPAFGVIRLNAYRLAACEAIGVLVAEPRPAHVRVVGQRGVGVRVTEERDAKRIVDIAALLGAVLTHVALAPRAATGGQKHQPDPRKTTAHSPFPTTKR